LTVHELVFFHALEPAIKWVSAINALGKCPYSFK